MNEEKYPRERILTEITDILNDMTRDWDLEFSGQIGGDTKLVADLNFESIDIVQFIVAIEERFQRRGLPWEEILMSGGRYVDEIRVGDAVDLLHPHLNEAR